MPNYVTQKVLICGTDDECKTIRELMDKKPANFDEDNDSNYFNFNQIIPMPESLNMKSGSAETIAELLINSPKYDFQVPSLNENRETYFNHLTEETKAYFSKTDPSKLNDEEFQDYTNKLTDIWGILNIADKHESYSLKDTIQYLDNKRKYGATSWYEWSYANWGTKWNAGTVAWGDANNIISLETAWSVPEPVYEALTKKFPTVKLIVLFADEDTGSNCGIAVYNNGVETYHNPEEKDDNRIISTAFANIMWGYHYDSFEDWCSENGYNSVEDAENDYSDSDYLDTVKKSIDAEDLMLNIAKLSNVADLTCDVKDIELFVDSLND